jgi:hypothetical protein
MYSWCLIYILVYISGYIIALVMGVPNYWFIVETPIYKSGWWFGT